MINAIENAIDVVRKAARDQSDSIVRELNADYDARNVALTVYNNALQQVRAIREQADGLERAAQDAFNSAMTSSGGVTLAIVNQWCWLIFFMVGTLGGWLFIGIMIWLLRKENHHEKSNAVRAPRPAADPRRDETRRPVHDHVERQAQDGYAPQAWR